MTKCKRVLNSHQAYTEGSMEGNNIVDKAQKAYEKSLKELEELRSTITRQNEEFQLIRQELESLGLSPNAVELIPDAIRSLTFPKELSGIANSFLHIMEELQSLREVNTTGTKQGKKSNPMNKLKML